MRHIAVLLLFALPLSPLQARDPCEKKLPESLQSLLGDAVPGARLILTRDYSPDTIESERMYHGGNPCLAVEGADFDGDGHRDFIFLLRTREKAVKAFVALWERESWRIEPLWDLRSKRPGCCYVSVLEPGTYENFYGAEADPSQKLEPGEVLKYTSKRPGPIVGGIGSSGVAFFLRKGRWIHVWVSD